MLRTLLVLAMVAAASAPAAATPFDGGSPLAAWEAPAGPPFRAEVVSAPDSVVAGDLVTLHFVLRVPAEHYVYAERTGLEILPQPGIEIVGVTAPAPKRKMDPFLDEEVEVYDHDAEFAAQLRAGWPVTVLAVLSSHGCSPTFCFFPQSDTLEVALAVAGPPAAVAGAAAPAAAEPDAVARVHAAAERGLVWLLVLAFGAGVATSLTPCVYPMIPITISIIGARSAGRRSKGFTLSLLYVLGIAIMYSALGTSAALTGSLFGSVLQNAWVVGGVALVFALMAMSLFGAFELQVPARFAGRMHRVQGSGHPGAFLLGLVAGIVASPCVGPVLVAMLAYVAAAGSPTLGFALFFTFALGLGVLFVLLGTFTGMVASLPKSGGWMSVVKIGFGLVFLGVALYYLHPLLPRGRWTLGAGAALLGTGLALGALRAIHEAEPAARRWRKALGRALAAGGAYALATGLLAARPPVQVPGPAWVESHTQGRELSAQQGKPMLVDFSAAWCGACKELEHHTFSDARVIDLAARFVAVRVDATTRTPELDALMHTYGIRGLPWVAFVTPAGEILGDLTVTGFVPAESMLERMRRALPGPAAASATGP